MMNNPSTKKTPLFETRLSIKTSNPINTLIDLKTNGRSSKLKNSSLLSVDRHWTTLESEPIDDDLLFDRKIQNQIVSKPTSKSRTRIESGKLQRPSSFTLMLLNYAQKAEENSSNEVLHHTFNVLELHFNAYTDNEKKIRFEGLFRILHEFQERISEKILIEVMEMLKIDPIDSINFEQFILILCNLPNSTKEYQSYLDLFNEIDYNHDSYITINDIDYVLPHLIAHFNREIIEEMIRIINIDQDKNCISYFDFLTGLMAIEECENINSNRIVR